MMSQGNGDTLFPPSGEPFSEDERRAIRKLMQERGPLHELASGWKSFGFVGRWTKIIAAWIGGVIGTYVAYRAFRDGGGPPQ